MTDYNKQLVELLKELDISDETIVSIEMIIKKKNISAKDVIMQINKYSPNSINDDSILDLALILK
jgi:hypothetical protein